MKDILKVVVFVGLFLIPFLPVYVVDGFFFPYITGKNFAFRIIIEIVFASWVMLALYDARYRPRFSWILATFAIFLGVMAFANALGQYPLQSFWSNFERMDGYVTLVHLFMYIVVAGSVFTTNKLWSYFFHMSLVLALGVALYGLGQYTGVIQGSTSGGRIDSSLGNPAYMAVYMLFHIFMLFWLFVRSNITVHKITYGVVAVILAYVLLLTGTRGTFLGFVGGSAVMVAYIALFGRAYPELRKVAIGACVAVVILATGFFVVKDSEFVQNQSSLARIANISLEKDLVTRGTIWKMALEGVKERPLLGWGQGNFNYVFNKQYDSSLYGGEAWFDRTHSIIFDWLIAGGILGFLSYLSILVAAFYYIFFQPLFKKNGESSFNVLERGVLIGLLAGYTLHNLVVFDNIISYIFFGTILALIHSRVSTKIDAVESFKVDKQMLTQFAMPLVVLVLGTVIYFVNVPGIGAAGDVIDAIQAPTVQDSLTKFDIALGRHSFATQEIVEQFLNQAVFIARNTNLPKLESEAFVQRAEQETLRLIEEKQGDARLHSFLARLYRSTEELEKARMHIAIAHELSPQKPSIVTDQAITELQAGDMDTAIEFFKAAFELDEANTRARVLYAALLIKSKKIPEAKALLDVESLKAFALDDYALSVVSQSGDIAFLIELLKLRIVARPDVTQERISLASVYYEIGQIDNAIEVLQKAQGELPDFAKQAECFIKNIKAGKNPDTSC